MDEALTPRRDPRTAPPVRPAGAHYAAAVTAAVGLGLTLLVHVIPQLEDDFGNRRAHVGIEMAAASVLVFVAAVLLGRFRLNRSRRTLLKLAAVVVLVLDNLFSATLTMLLDSVSAQGFATWSLAGNALIGAALLAVAALLPDRPVPQTGRAVAVVLGASIGAVGVNIGLAGILNDVLPTAFDVPPETGADLRLLSEHPALIVVELSTAACFGVAAVGFARLADDEADEFLKWLSISVVLAAVAYINYALFPSQFTELIYSGDIFFLAAVVTLAYGSVREIAREEAVQIRSAVLEERRRVARDLHDGVAQELAFISTQAQWYMREPGGQIPLGEILGSVERALDESRGAIAALSRPMDEPLDIALGEAALEVANRVGTRVTLNLDKTVEVPPAWREALLRIAREAVGNAARHGRARTVGIELRDDDGIRLRVTDDGVGFDVAGSTNGHGFGLTSMRERTESLGGRFAIESKPGSGTTVEVLLP